MGLSSSKQTTTNDPSKFAQPYITAGANALQSAYGETQPLASSISSTIGAQLPGLADKAFNPDPNITAALGYNTDVLDGKYLDAGNPYLQGQINSTNNDITDKINATFGAAGRTGSGGNTYSLGKALAQNENNLRYTDYTNERSRMSTAAGQAPSLAAGQYSGLAAYLQAAAAATGLPQEAAGNYASGLGSLLGQYSTKTGTSTPSLLSGLGQAVNIGTDAVSLFSDRRLKTNIRKIGEHADGLGRYVWNYVWGGPQHEGVMADEVAQLRPWALGPVVSGFSTVAYGRL